MSRSLRYDSTDEDLDAETYCVRVSAALEAKLAFEASDRSASRSSGKEGAGQKGGARVYTTFHVDSLEDESEDCFSDEYAFSSLGVLGAGACEVVENSDHAQDPPISVLKGSGTADDDDGWNSDLEDFPLTPSTYGMII